MKKILSEKFMEKIIQIIKMNNITIIMYSTNFFHIFNMNMKNKKIII